MTKSLLDKIGKRARKAIFLAAAGLALSGCPPPIPGPDPKPVNYAPVTTLYANPLSGQAPLTARLKTDGTDQNGKQDIKQYELSIDIGEDGTIDEFISQSSPIDIIRTFTSQGKVKIYGQCTDEGGLTDKKEAEIVVSDVSVVDYLDVSGRLEDCENDGIGRSGVARIYNASDNSFLKQVDIDGSGNFSTTLTQKVSDLPNGVIIQAATGTSPYTSYVRTKRFPQGDVNAGTIRAVPLPTISTANEFKTFMNQIDFSSSNGMIRFDLNHLDGIEILLDNPDASKGSFTVNEQNVIESQIKDSNGIELYVEGRQLDSFVQKDTSSSSHHYTGTSNIIPDVGWVIVAPNNSVGGGRTNYFWDFDNSRTSTKRARIDLSVVNNVVPTHEFGHVFIAANPDTDGHCTIPPFYNPSGTDTLTMMVPNNLPLTVGPADIKASKIIYESTYNAGENLDDVLGNNFLP